MTPDQQDKFDEFQAIREAVGKTTLLSSIFDETWFKKALPKIMSSSLPGMVAADSSSDPILMKRLEEQRCDADQGDW